MERQGVPTLGRVLQLLRDLGFVEEPAAEGVIAYAHAASGADMLYRKRDLNSPARHTELANLRAQLTYRGLLTEAEFERFLADKPLHTASSQ